MGPRQKSLGNFDPNDCYPIFDLNFNGAEAKKPRKSHHMQISRIVDHDFNGAEAKKPRKYRLIYRASRQVGTSMGPRQKSLGNLIVR